AQTPQVFACDLIKQAHEQADPSTPATDDAALVERLGRPVRIVIPNRPNPKVTVPDDLRVVALLLEEEAHA
ncbi:MAG: 2-C-methyl-D-erythritol 4-phosphate cytidylyltransferase, partial [Candidatus Zixiibacteriota bacterium]